MGVRSIRPARRQGARRLFAVLTGAALLITALSATATAQTDPRVGLPGGAGEAAGQAIWNMEKLASLPKPAPVNGTNSDLAFTGDYVISGNYTGFNVYDVSDPADPQLVTQVVCPGSQNDVSVYGDLLFLSVEQTTANVDCTTGGTTSQRIRGVRIFDISDIHNPVLVNNVQTCKGSHTHTLASSADDPDNVYVYVSGTSTPRGTTGTSGWPGCTNMGTSSNPILDEDHTRYSIEVIQVPLDAPQDAEVIRQARIFRDEETGQLNGLQNGPTQPLHPCAAESACAPGAPASGTYSPSPNTHTCHDITTYPALGLAAGACQGNGILLDISDPADPQRLDAVADVNFSYWHSATLNNDGTTVVFTDEWGGGGGARCMPNHRTEWGANAIFDVVQTEDGPKMEFASYYKLPAPQSAQENCVAHNGSLIPVPGRDIMVQAWYQGGTSVFDFTDSANPTEIAYFDRGPISTGTNLISGGFWSTYWYNGFIYGNEISRGFDSFALTSSDHLNDVEIAAALQVTFDESNVQHQDQLTWPATFTTVRAWHSAAQRQGVLDADVDADLTVFIDRAERFQSGPQKPAAVATLRAVTNQLGDSSVEAGLSDALIELADALG